jgi:hypothetical protein
MPINPYESLFQWVLYAIVGMLIFLSLEIPATLLFAKGSKDILYRIKNIRKK